jgi:5-methylcytosine-specific restriction endonuclease McrA
VAALSPQPPVPPTIRKLPATAPAALLPLSAGAPPATTAPVLVVPGPRREERVAVVTPLSEETFKIVFTASRETRQTLVAAQGLLRHRVPDGDIATIVAMALHLLVEHVTKERFGAGRKTRAPWPPAFGPASRNIPAAIRRAVFERDGGRCAFVSSDGRRCESTDGLEIDHVEGFARTHVHEIDKLRLVCRAHNQHAADQMYGREFMDKTRAPDDINLSRDK